MDTKNTIDFIIRDLRETRVIINDFKNYPEIPILQIELALSKCKSAEELMRLLQLSPVQQADTETTLTVLTTPDPEKVKAIIQETAEIDIPKAEKTGHRVTETGQKGKAITILADAISLNEKFIFVKEIFSGDQANYKEAIKKLNRVENINDAKAIIMSYTGEIEENDAFLRLIELVKRKISVNE